MAAGGYAKWIASFRISGRRAAVRLLRERPFDEWMKTDPDRYWYLQESLRDATWHLRRAEMSCGWSEVIDGQLAEFDDEGYLVLPGTPPGDIRSEAWKDLPPNKYWFPAGLYKEGGQALYEANPLAYGPFRPDRDQ